MWTNLATQVTLTTWCPVTEKLEDRIEKHTYESLEIQAREIPKDSQNMHDRLSYGQGCRVDQGLTRVYVGGVP